MTCVFIRGNYDRANLLGFGKEMIKFEKEVKDLIVKLGYKYRLCISSPHTQPPKGDLYIVHSRGISRVKYLDINYTPLVICDHYQNTYNPDNLGHYELTDSLREVIEVTDKMIRKRA